MSQRIYGAMGVHSCRLFKSSAQRCPEMPPLPHSLIIIIIRAFREPSRFARHFEHAHLVSLGLHCRERSLSMSPAQAMRTTPSHFNLSSSLYPCRPDTGVCKPTSIFPKPLPRQTRFNPSWSVSLSAFYEVTQLYSPLRPVERPDDERPDDDCYTTPNVLRTGFSQSSWYEQNKSACANDSLQKYGAGKLRNWFR